MSSIFEGREVYKPYDFPEVEKNFTEPVQDGYWVHRELEFDKDVQNYKTDLTEVDRQIISRILRTFSEVEVHVADDLWSKIGRFLPRPEFCEMGYAFAENESRHASAYFRINEVLNLKEFEPYSKDPILSDKFENLINSSLNFDFDKTNPEHIKRFAFGLAVFSAFTERVALFGQFMILKSFSSNGRNFMKTVGNVIDWSKREESLHGDGGIYIFNKIKDECNWIWTNEFKSSIYVAFTTGMDIETKLIKDIFDDNNLPNLTSDQVINYMKNRANDSLKRLGLKAIFDIDEKVLEDTKWFDLESNATQFTDFLAGSRPTDYTKNMVVFDESTVKVSENFLNKLDKNYIIDGRMD